MNTRKRELNEKSEIVYKTVSGTIIVTNQQVDQKWVNIVNDSMRIDSNLARKERYHCFRLDIADDRDEWVASHADDPFYNLCRETPEEERNRLRYAISQLSDDQKRLIEYVYYKGYSLKAFAELEGVDPSAITRRHCVILKKLKEIF